MEQFATDGIVDSELRRTMAVREHRAGPDVAVSGATWAVVLAGGQGVRMRPLIHRIYGDDRPKQFASLVGSRSLLRQTLDRIGTIVSPQRTVAVIHESQTGYLPEALAGAEVGHVLRQPADRGTAAGVLFPVHWINHRDPDAIVAVFPSDHFVLEEERFVEHVHQVIEAVRHYKDWLVLLGAVPTDADPDYGWIEPGDAIECTSSGAPISRVQRFWEKPSVLAAQRCLEQGWLWNTFVLFARASVFLDLSRQFLPRLDEALSLMQHCWDTEEESRVLARAYGATPSANLSRSILEQRPSQLVVAQLPALAWSDWGRPERVIRSLQRALVLPSWFRASDVVPEGATLPASACATAAPTEGRGAATPEGRSSAG